ncbi:MAG: Hsp33 family molecular chaperone HslO [Caldilineales bacterium]
MSDIILRVLARNAGLRVLACTSTELAQEAARRHDTSPIAAAALGYGLTAGALLGATLKVGQRVALRFAGDGPLVKMVVEADAYGRVRGYVVRPDAPSPERLDSAAVADAIGSGLLTVVKDLRVKDLYQGAVALTGDGPEQDLTRYLVQSEQLPTLLRLAVEMDETGTVRAAGGIYIELMPGHEADELALIAARLDTLPPIGEMLLDGQSLDHMVERLLNDIDYLLLERMPVAFVCSCSRARSRMALKALGTEDILEMIVEGEAVVDCHFCHERYVFSANELMEILDEMEAAE